MNITPLIDVVLVLLIIFMVMAPNSLKHLRPTIAKEAPPAVEVAVSPVVVALSEAGVPSVNGKDVSWESLAATVQAGLVERRQDHVFLQISDSAEYGRAVRLMDICRGAGARVLGLSPRGA